MTREAVSALVASSAFRPYPDRATWGRIYEPFGPSGTRPAPESRLQNAARNCQKIALVGPSGSGKSILAHNALQGPGLAHINVPVAFEDESTVTSPKAFAEFLVRSVVTFASGYLSDRDREEALRRGSRKDAGKGRQTATKVATSAGIWGWLNVQLARDVTTLLPAVEQARTMNEMTEAVHDVLQIVAMRDLTPVVVLDDSDRFAAEDRARLIGPFFRNVIQWAASELGECGLVVSCSPDFNDNDAFTKAMSDGVLETRVLVPKLASADALMAILGKRVTDAGLDGGWPTAFEPSAKVMLYNYYKGPAKFSVRRVMNVAQGSVSLADTNTKDLVSGAMVTTAIAETGVTK